MIALFGGRGSIGSRYACIMNAQKIPFEIVELGDKDPDWSTVSKAIIATPTETHLDIINRVPSQIPILCEKPITKSMDIPERDNLFVVNNYAYVCKIKGLMPPFSIWYNYFKTGGDGLFWDCCQLLFLDRDAKLDTDSPRWNLTINRQWIKYRDLEESYVRMINDFYQNKFHLMWGMDIAKEMNRNVIARVKHDSPDINSSKVRF